MTANPKYLDFLGKMKTKKISLNIEERKLQFIDDLANLMKANRTIIMASIIEAGTPYFIETMEKEWTKLEKSENKVWKETSTNLLKKLKILKKKHDFNKKFNQ